MSKPFTAMVNKELKRSNAAFGQQLAIVPKEDWPASVRGYTDPPIQVWRSRDFLVTVWDKGVPGIIARLSVIRTTVSNSGRWKDGISWDDLQRLKSECGYGDFDAVEIFPRDCDVVNVANMRHLWVTTFAVPFAWRKDRG